jgi:hypothetical protein
MAYDWKDLIGCSGATITEVADQADRDRGNLNEQIKKALREGGRLSKKMDRDVFEALCAIHRETPLHTFPSYVMGFGRALRERESQALTRVADCCSAQDSDAIREAFEAAARLVTDPFHKAITSGLEVVERDGLDDDDRATLLCGAQVLQTTIEIWEDAAAAMSKLGLDDSDLSILDFKFLEIDGIESVIDVAEKAATCYEDLDHALAQLARSKDGDPKVQPLLDRDRQVASTNIASIAAHGFDWVRAKPELLDCIETRRISVDGPQARSKILERARALCDRGKEPFEASMELRSENMVLARNTIYIARQQQIAEIDPARRRRMADVEQQVVQHVAKIVEITPQEVYDTDWLPGRKPLCDEPPFATTSSDVTRSHIDEETE